MTLENSDLAYNEDDVDNDYENDETVSQVDDDAVTRLIVMMTMMV